MALSPRAAILVLLGIIPLVFFPSTTFVWGWVLLCVLIFCLDAVLAVSPFVVSISREVESSIRADQSAESTVTVTNPTRRGIRLLIRDGWPPSCQPSPARHEMRLPGGAKGSVTTVLSPTRRGTRTADYVTIRIYGPLGLAARQASISAPVHLSVLPEFRARKILPSRLARLHELEGTTATVLRGPGTEFDSLREYVRGDDPRDIDWRASARSKDLVVRTWRPERDRHVVIVTDTGRAGALLLGAPDTSTGDADVLDLGSTARLDAQIEAALLLAALADRAGDQVHFLAVDREVRARVSGVRGGPLMHTTAESLVDVHPSLQPIDWDLVVREVDRTVRHRSLIVLATEIPPVGSDPDFTDAVRRLSQRHVVLVASAQDPDLARAHKNRSTAEEVFTASAAASVLREENASAVDLRRAGAVVVATDAGLLAARTSDTYLELKKAGKL
ncbi:MAG: DUF58 domain-containing protein [Actinomycetaceae bacterium]|nr:DUF58 domain-containing protein [Actinomycetaceae bacterium]